MLTLLLFAGGAAAQDALPPDAKAAVTFPFALGDLPAQSETTLQFDATVNAILPAGVTLILNQATASNPVTSATSNVTMTPLDVKTDLWITKDNGVTTVVPGDPVTYTITAGNAGPFGVNGAAVADVFPAVLTGVTWTCVSAGGASCTAGPVAGNINDSVNLPVGATVTYTATGTLDAGATGTLSNTATVTSPIVDSNPSNNSATDADTIAGADLAITKSDGVSTAAPGTSLTYTIVASNAGPTDAPLSTVTDTFPAVLTSISWTCVAAGGATCTPAGSGDINDTVNLPAGSSATYTVTGDIDPAATGTLSNTATVTAGPGVTDPDPGNNSATDTTTLTPEADLTITKTDTPDPVNAGESLTYTVSVLNNGPSDATNVVVTDTLPAGVTLITSIGCAEDPNGVPTCSLGTLGPGASASYTIEVAVDPDTEGTITNTASVTSDSTDPDPSDNTVSENTDVQGRASLTVTKADSADPVIAGQPLTYTLDVANAGPSTAQAVTLYDLLPDGAAYVTDSLGSCSQPIDLDGLRAALSGDNEVPPVTTLATGTAAFALDTATSQLHFAVHVTDLTGAVSAHIHQAPAGANGPVVHTLYEGVPILDGANPITGVLQLTVPERDALLADPPGFYVNVHTTAFPAGEIRGQLAASVNTPVRCDLGVLAPASNLPFTVDVDVAADAADGSSLENITLVSSTTTDPDAVPLPQGELAGATALEPTTVATEADLAITKSDSPDPVVAGTQLTYTVTVTNNGPSDAQDVVVTDSLPTGVSLVSTTGCAEDPNGVPTCTVGTLSAGASTVVTLTVLVDPATRGVITNSVSVSSPTTDPDAGNNTALEDTTVVASADLAVSKVGTPDPVIAGNDLTYTVSVDNAGPSDDLETVTVTDTLPAGVIFVSAIGSGWTCSEAGGVVTCARAGLAAGAAPDITIVVTVDPATRGALGNTVTVDSPTVDPNGTNNSASISTTVVASADLELVKTDAEDPLPVGADVEYLLTITNLGPSDATSVVVTDILPAGLTLVDTAGCAEDPTGVPTCTLGNLFAGDSVAFTITASVDPSPPPMVTNTATVAATEPDPDPSNNTDSEDTTLDLTPPTVDVVDTVYTTPDGELSECETVTAQVFTVTVTFSEEVHDPPGDVDPDDVTNPDNYLVVATGPDLELDTVQCGTVFGDDVAVAIASVSYDAVSSTARVRLAAPLAPSQHRLMVCGSTSIVDLAGNPLDGTGNGTGGDDFVRDFRADPGTVFANGHLDCDLGGWELESTDPMEIVWSTDDAGGSSISGSIGIANLAMNTRFAASQCAPSFPAVTHDLAGTVRLAAAAGVFIGFSRTCEAFASADCSGPVLDEDSNTMILEDTGGVWLDVADTVSTPEGTRSLRCTFSFDTASGAAFSANLDRLFLSDESAIFADGFESGDTSAWSLTTGE